MKTLLGILVILALLPGAVRAEGDERGRKHGGADRGSTLQLASVDPTWAKECSGCHIAYAPGLLPAASWRRVMAGLDKHFGSDASLTPSEGKDVTTFLVANADSRWSGTGAPLRITETQWFTSKHDAREVAPAVWKRASIKGPANCQACHAAADKADFNEHSVKIPL
jgi:hypothetical protein